MAINRRSYNFNNVDEIKSRCNIVDVIGRVVTLKKAGSSYKGLCPFHNEKTPSFSVDETRQSYKCFGCGEGGDVISFVQKYYSLDFMEAMELLAKEYGIELKKNDQSSAHSKEYYEINRLAARFFYRALREHNNPGYTYMRRRGISDETLNTFGIGYADEKWTSLTDHLVNQGIDPVRLVEVGLSSEKDGRYYDKFRGRVIFPIINTGGKVIGFGGRIIADGEPKYLNSKESSVFQKKNNLYALNVTKDYVKKEDRIILVEGYMDVISLYQAGIRNVSASLGTALTENQARLIKRYTSEVILSYDADAAGQKAALRGLDILYGEDLRAKVLVVTDGKDPDEFIKAKGRDAYLKLADEALPFGDFKLKKAAERYDITDNQQKLRYIRDAIRILKGMKPVEADMYLGRLSEETGISEEAIRREYESGKDNQNQSAFAAIIGREQSAEDEISEAEQELLKLMLIDSDFVKLPEDIREDVFRDRISSSIYAAIKAVDKGERPLDMGRITDQIDIECSQLLNTITSKVIPGDREKDIYEDCISFIRTRKLIREADRITARLRDPNIDKQEAEKLMQRQIEIQRSIKG
ncbi:MAG: DNA primase [Firmicutes bacterium]|nr:DNA primase [Bacillota bacterium]